MWKCVEKTEQVGDNVTWVHLRFELVRPTPDYPILSGAVVLSMYEEHCRYEVGDSYATLPGTPKPARAEWFAEQQNAQASAQQMAAAQNSQMNATQRKTGKKVT